MPAFAAGPAESPSPAARDAALTPLTGWTLANSSVWGTDQAEEGKKVVADAQGNVYILGTVEEATDDPYATNKNLMILKVNKADDTVKGVVIGGTSLEEAQGLAVDAAGNIYVAANSWSFDKANTPDTNEGFPLTDNAYSTSEEGAPHAVVFKMNPGMDTLLYSSRFPYSEIGGLAVDPKGFVYITGGTGNGLTTTPGVLQPTSTCGWTGSAYLAKFDMTKSGQDSLVYSTFLTGEGCGQGVAVAADADGNAYVTGTGVQQGLPVTDNAPQKTFGGSVLGDVFVMKVNPDGTKRLFSTYLGGEFDEYSTALAIDPQQNIYVTGWAYLGFPTTPGSFQPDYFPGDCEPGHGTTVCSDAFVTKYKADGSLAYSSFLGGVYWDNGQGITADAEGNAYVVGQSMSLNFPLVNPLTDKQGGSRDAFVTVINPEGSKILLSTMFGGDGEDMASGVAVDSERKTLYVVGTAKSATFQTKDPLKVEALPGSSAQYAFRGDLFFTKINLNGTAEPSAKPGDVNGDGTVNIADATMTLSFTVHLAEPTPAQLQAADVNGDGKVTISDATKILRMAVGLG